MNESQRTPKYPNEAAFPQPHLMRLEGERQYEVLLPAQWGLTKREYAAIRIAAGMARFKLPGTPLPESTAREAVELADAVLKELSK